MSLRKFILVDDNTYPAVVFTLTELNRLDKLNKTDIMFNMKKKNSIITKMVAPTKWRYFNSRAVIKAILSTSR